MKGILMKYSENVDNNGTNNAILVMFQISEEL